jgi:hypothetical protein
MRTLLATLLIATSLTAGETTQEAHGCASYMSYKALLASDGDRAIIGMLLSSGECFTVNPGVKVDLISATKEYKYVDIHGIKVFLLPNGVK